ncbi:MAG: ATP-binding protein [Actinomycetota bacterium]
MQRRATAELETNALVTAETIAAALGPEEIERARGADAPLDRLQAFVSEEAEVYGAARVLIVEETGIVIADSDGAAQFGANYAEPERTEIINALRGVPSSVIRRSDDLGQEIMATAVPVFDEGRRLVGAVRITQSVQDVRDSVRRTTLGLIAIGAAGLLAGLLLAFGLAGSLSRPLTKLAAAARRLGSGDLSARAEGVGGATEIEELGRSFDEMADRLERTVLAQREFVANASHQLRTPLTGMKLRLEGAMAETSDGDVRHQLEAADREVDRLSEIVTRLLAMSHDIEAGEPIRIDLADAVARAVTRWAERAGRLRATLVPSGDGGTAQGNPSDLDQILDNLLDNAITYAPGEIELESGRRDGVVFIAVQDHGPGIETEELARVTERFYRGRGAPSGGSGLGLAIARDLAEKWGGTIAVSSTVGEGTRVEVRLRSAS